jgi:hypothetical protein
LAIWTLVNNASSLSTSRSSMSRGSAIQQLP